MAEGTTKESKRNAKKIQSFSAVSTFCIGFALLGYLISFRQSNQFTKQT